MAGPEAEIYVDEINASQDLDAIALHDQINEGLVEDRAACALGSLESLEASRELAAEIADAVVSDEEVITLVLDARKHQVLTRARRLGGMAASLAIQP